LDTERQDWIDMLRGREKRQKKEYYAARDLFLRSFGWVDEPVSRAVLGITSAQYRDEIAPTYAPRLEASCAALLAWLMTREELAALEGKQR
jgi:hypothetical protein